MIGYYVPHRVYPAGYHCNPKQPLPFACLASQKNYMSLYLMTVYGDGAHWQWFRDAWAKTGKKLDMGQCCIRFKKLDDLALDVIAEALRRTPVNAYLEFYEAALQSLAARRKARPMAKKKTAKGPSAGQQKPGGTARR
jgi:hypothetical protein